VSIRLWKENKPTGAWELSEEEVARRFLASEYAGQLRDTWPLDRALAAFISVPQGLNSSWEDRDAFSRIVNRIVILERTTDNQE